MRFWGRHLLLLNVVLFGLVWLLYGNLRLFGLGRLYAVQSVDINLLDYRPVSSAEPGVENVLLPALAAAFRRLWMAVGLEYTDTTFVILSALAAIALWGYLWEGSAFST